MTASLSLVRRQRLRLAVIVALVVLGLRVLGGIVYEYRLYFPANFTEATFLIGREESFTPVYAAAFYTHILSGPPAILLAGFLLWSGGVARYRHWHRWAARVLMLLIFVTLVPSGLLMAQRAFAGPIAGAAFVALSLATAITAGCTLYYARARRFAVHQRWAVRCFLLLVSPLILRVVSGTLMVIGYEEPLGYQCNAWLSWLVPLLAYEGWLRYSTSLYRVPVVLHVNTGRGSG
jgi:hypothetical protein